MLAAEQDLAGEQHHVHPAAIVDHETRHRGLVALGDDDLATSAGLLERVDGERQWPLCGVEPEDREPTVRSALADADSVETASGASRNGAKTAA